MNQLNVSTVHFEQEIRDLSEQLNKTRMELFSVNRKKEETALDFENKILKLESLLSQKDETIAQYKEQQEKSKNYKLILELEEKLEKAENYINEKAKSQLMNVSQRNLPSRARLSVLSLDKFPLLKLDSHETNGQKINSKLKNNFEKLDKLLKRKSRPDKPEPIEKEGNEYDDELVLNITEENGKTDTDKEDYLEIIEELHNIIKEEEAVKIDYQKGLDMLEQENTSLKKNLGIIQKQLIEKEETKLQLIQELDEIKVEREELVDLNDTLKAKNESLNRKMDKIHLSSSFSNKENLEYRLKIEELEDEVTNKELELKQAKKMITKEREKFETDFVEQQQMIETKDKTIYNLESKLEHLANKNQEFLNKLESQEDMQEYHDSQLFKQYQSNEVIYMDKIRDLEGRLNEVYNSVSKDGSNENLHDIDEKSNGYQMEALDFSFENDIQFEGVDESEFPVMPERSVINIDSDREIKSRRKTTIRKRQVSESVVINKNKNESASARKERDRTEMLRMIDEISTKNKEIQNLRRDLIEANQNNKTQELQNEVDNLNLQLKHIKENNSNDRECFEKEKALLQKNLDEMTMECVNAKIKYTEVEAVKDTLVLKYNREIKKLNFQIQMYVDQVVEHNRRASQQR